MKRTLMILSAILILNSSTELHQLFRLPLLLEHYRHHRSEDPSITLLSFLKLHYTGNHPNDKDDDQDSQLPFKDANNTNHTDVQVMIKKDLPSRPLALIKGDLTPYYPGYIPDQQAESIFHPPRLS